MIACTSSTDSASFACAISVSANVGSVALSVTMLAGERPQVCGSQLGEVIETGWR